MVRCVYVCVSRVCMVRCVYVCLVCVYGDVCVCMSRLCMVRCVYVFVSRVFHDVSKEVEFNWCVYFSATHSRSVCVCMCVCACVCVRMHMPGMMEQTCAEQSGPSASD